MNSAFKFPLFQAPLKPFGKSLHQTLTLIASNLGQRAIAIYKDIRSFKESQGTLKDYDLPRLKYKPHHTQSSVCAKILNKKMKAFKCFDCIFQNNSIMCIQCFEHSDHKGHIYEVVDVHGGCCDCGDEEKWDPKGFCSNHSKGNLVQEMKKKVNPRQEEAFIEELSMCVVYWFMIYNESQLYLMEGQPPNNEDFIAKNKEIKYFGDTLMEYLNKFNKQSLISNIMTFNFLTSKLKLENSDLAFCPKASEKCIFEIILHMTRLGTCSELVVNLYTQLFTLKEFRRILTISFIGLHRSFPQFAMSEFNQLSCQLLTSHKTITQLVNTKQIQPLVYKPKKEKIGSFQELAQNFVRYFIDVEYLVSLYKGASLVYVTYHIMEGEFPSLGFYKQFTYEWNEAVNCYGIEEIRFNRLIKLLKILFASDNSLHVFEKAISDSWAVIQLQNKKWNKNLFSTSSDEQTALNHIYLTHETALSITLFLYLEKLEKNDPTITEQAKISRIIKLLSLESTSTCIQQIHQTLQVLHNHLTFAGLTLGHPQTLDRYYTFFSFTFKKSLSVLSSTMFFYKIMFKVLLKLYESLQLAHAHSRVFLSDQFIFQRPLATIEELFNKKDFQDDDQSIYDRKKHLIRLSYFLHLLTQIAQTDMHELILASFFDLPSKVQKYSQMLSHFYLQLVKTYKKIHLKQFKRLADEFIHNQTAFQKFLTTSKDIIIEHGHISQKPPSKDFIPQSSTHKDTPKIQTQINSYYFKAFKNKLTNSQQEEIAFKVPSSSNHFLHQILSDSFIDRLLTIIFAYIDIIAIKDGKIKQRESGTLGLLVIEVIKIQKALKHKHSQQGSNKISSFFKALKNKASLTIFTKQVIKLICSQFQEQSSDIHQSIKYLAVEDQKKNEQRKKKLQLKKQKLKSKYKQNQEKFEGVYAVQLQKIKLQMIQEKQDQTQNNVQDTKQCIVCKQTQTKSKFNLDLMLMSFMHLSDIYHQFLKGKHQNTQNCHLVFKTCGHFIHQTCYQKINKKKQYTHCQLCKSPVNCLLTTASLKLTEKSDLNEDEIHQLENIIYENLSANFSYLFSMDDSLRQDCQNSFGQPLTDKRDAKLKLIESLIINTIMSAVINKDETGTFYEKKQFQAYQHILHNLRVFCKWQDLKAKLNTNSSKKQQLQAQKQKERTSNAIQQEKMLQSKIKNQENKEKKLVLQITYMIESYVRKTILNFIERSNDSTKQQEKYLSNECIEILNNAIQKLIGKKSSSKSHQQINLPQENFDYCKEIKLLRENLRFYSPPESLQNLIEMRGKCPNCNLFNNHILVCVICKWIGCKNCKQESVARHTALKHAGNSIFLEADLGNVYLVTKKKYWAFPSVYTDYLGESFKHYAIGTKLDKFSLSEQKWKSHVKKTFLEYDIDTRIRYEENNTKRSFTIPI